MMYPIVDTTGSTTTTRHTPEDATKPDRGPLCHVLGLFTRVWLRRARARCPQVDRVEFERRLAAAVVRAEVEAAAVDRLLAVRSR